MYLVTIERYSLEADLVGQTIGLPEVISRHRSRAAAGRMLGSLISGKRQNMRRERERGGPDGRGVGVRLLARCTETGDLLARNACR